MTMKATLFLAVVSILCLGFDTTKGIGVLGLILLFFINPPLLLMLIGLGYVIHVFNQNK